jgi:hypothetical protein
MTDYRTSPPQINSSVVVNIIIEINTINRLVLENEFCIDTWQTVHAHNFPVLDKLIPEECLMSYQSKDLD